MRLRPVILHQKKLNFAVRMFVSYMAGVLLLVGVTFLFIHHFFIGMIAGQAEDNVNEAMQRFCSSLDYQIRAMNRISSILEQDYDVRLRSGMSAYDSYKICNKLRYYAAVNQNLADIAILDEKSGGMVSASGVTSIEDYFYLYYRFEQDSGIPQTILKADAPIMTSFFFSGGTALFPGEYFFYALPSMGGKRILFTIDKKYFSNAVQNLSFGSGGYLCILDSAFSPMTEFPLPECPFPQQQIASVIGRLKTEGYSSVRLDLGNGIYAGLEPCAAHAWSYCIISDHSAIYNRLRGSYLIYFLSLGGILALGMVLSFLLSRFNSLPLRKAVRRLLPQSAGEMALDDLRLITGALEDIRLENTRLSQSILEKNESIILQLLQLTLVGARDAEQVREELEHAGLCLQERFHVLCFMDAQERASQLADALAGRLRAENGDWLLFHIKMQKSFGAVLILNTGRLLQEGELEAAAGGLLPSDMSVGIGGGGPLEELPHSFRQSLTAAQMAVSQKRPFLFYEQIQKGSHAGFYPAISRLREALVVALRSIRPEEVELCAERYFSFLEDKSEKRYEYYNLYSELIVLGEQTGYVCTEDAFWAAESAASGEMAEKLRRLLRELCAHLESQKIRAKKQLKFQVADYLRMHYSDNMLSVTRVAEHFGVSESYLDRYFKEYFGSTLTVFLDEIRMEKATLLLQTGGDRIKNVVESVGYIDVNNFNRKFKRKYGMTPGQYRASCNIEGKRPEESSS